jgi:hypothetical protein
MNEPVRMHGLLVDLTVPDAAGKFWQFKYDKWARADRDKRIIYIEPDKVDASSASQLSHEVGHAVLAWKPDWSSRDAYIGLLAVTKELPWRRTSVPEKSSSNAWGWTSISLRPKRTP